MLVLLSHNGCRSPGGYTAAGMDCRTGNNSTLRRAHLHRGHTSVRGGSCCSGRLFLMRFGVLDHAVLADETFAADLTGEWFLSGVEAHVTAEVSLMVKLFGAHLTFVRFVSGMLR